jgi:hypothetical protein
MVLLKCFEMQSAISKMHYSLLYKLDNIKRAKFEFWDTLQKVGIWHFWYSFAKNAKFSDSMTSSPKSGSLKSGSQF